MSRSKCFCRIGHVLAFIDSILYDPSSNLKVSVMWKYCQSSFDFEKYIVSVRDVLQYYLPSQLFTLSYFSVAKKERVNLPGDDYSFHEHYEIIYLTFKNEIY